MPETIIIPNGIVTMAKSVFDCPNCKLPIVSEDYYARLERTPKINAKCPKCNTRLTLTINYKNGISAYIKPKKR